MSLDPKSASFRQASQGDSGALADLARTTFWDTYRGNDNADNRDLEAYMSEAFSARQIGSELLDPDVSFLIAECGVIPAGYAKLIFGKTLDEINCTLPVEISRIYLKREVQGTGLGSALLERCFAEGRKRGCDVIWLSVWQYNERAIEFYEKHGFRKSGTHVFDLAGTEHTDLVMQREL